MADAFMPNFQLTGRRALVIGAGSGIGRASALALAAAGADVAVTEQRERIAAAEETARVIESLGVRSAALALDVREVAEIQATVDAAAEALGGLDTLVASAGTNVQRAALEVSEADWDAVVDVNLRGVFFCVQQAARHMLAGGRGGSVVVISSQLGTVGVPGGQRAAYGASKGGVINLVRMLAIEWASQRIRVNSVAPATTNTPMNAALFADAAWRERMLARIPLGEFITPEDSAAAVVFLASDAARMVTGQTLLVDGGWTAW